MSARRTDKSAPSREPSPSEFASAYQGLVWQLATMQYRSQNAAERVALDELITFTQALEAEAKKAAESEVSA